MKGFWSDPIVILIVFLGIVDVIIGAFVLMLCDRLEDDLSPRERRANPRKRRETISTKIDSQEHEDKVLKKSSTIDLLYLIFVNLTSILPLLGMFGTVKALLGLAGDMNVMDVPVDQFFSALYTTAAGLVMAMINKGLDAFVSHSVAKVTKEIDTLQARNTQRFPSEEEYTSQGIGVGIDHHPKNKRMDRS